MTNARREKLLWLALRIVVSAVCIAYVVTKVQWQDRLDLADGQTVYGWISQRTDQHITIKLATGQQREFDLRDIARHPRTDAPMAAEGFTHIFSDVFTGNQWHWLIIAVLAYFTSPIFCAWRWRLLMKVQHFRVSFWDSWRLTYIGFFFNTFMLGMTGGDVVKAWYITRILPRQHKTEAVTTVFLDRAIGLFAMALLCVAALAIQFREPTLGREKWIISIFLAISLLAAILAYSRRVTRRLLPKAILSRLPMRQMLARAHAAIFVYRYHRRYVLAAIAQSWASHLVSIAAVYACARALGLQPQPIYFVIYMPIIWIAAAVFPSVGGLGVMEGLAQLYFTAAILGPTVTSTHQALALALAMILIYRAVMLVAVLPGGILNVLRSKTRPQPAAETRSNLNA